MTGPHPGPTPWPGQPEPHYPTGEQYAAYARQILAWHAPVPPTDGRAPNWCTCGTALVLCPRVGLLGSAYVASHQPAATRFLGPPAPHAG